MRRPSSPTEERPSRERWALAGLWVLVLAPVVAHGIWRPVLEALGGAGDALAVSLAAVAVAGAVVGAAARWP
ncbi:MAG: hypothetical protein KC549_15990, partial [Myxococcales bacterium]|nr:hypothetical protein [Myxococcales bacterium]